MPQVYAREGLVEGFRDGLHGLEPRWARGSRELASACGEHVRQLHKIAFEAQFGDFMLLDMGLLVLACDLLLSPCQPQLRPFGFS